MTVPRIAITAGEPAGIGADILAKISRHACSAELIAIGDPDLLGSRAAALGISLQLQPFDADLAPVKQAAGTLKVMPVPLAKACQPGKLDPANASYVLETLNRGAAGCMEGQFHAVVTAPVQKSVINDAGIAFSGHTEYFAERSNTPRVVMLLAAGNLRVALATTHLPLAQVPQAITESCLVESLHILHHDLKHKFRIRQPRIAVLGLNPHAGEAGHLGREELDVIIPALEKLRSQGLQLSGPLPADTAFNPRVLDDCDAVFAMYHDQGLPTLKYAGFGQAVNITLGLPFIRTSVDHGTALDLAGSGDAEESSLQAAIDQATQLVSV